MPHTASGLQPGGYHIAIKMRAACAQSTSAAPRFSLKETTMKQWTLGWGLLALLAALGGCAAPGSSVEPPYSVGAAGITTSTVRAGVAPIPGGYWMYSFGLGQTKENFANVERAQSDYALWSGRHWGALGPLGRATATMGALQAYYPLHVRWKLKDGREFILENIDTAAIMREYFKTHRLQLQWQREGRPEARVGDSEPLLAHEVKDDTVILKWVITFNLTPVAERLTSTGAATKWEFRQEEHIVAVLKGQPTSGIDFNKN